MSTTHAAVHHTSDETATLTAVCTPNSHPDEDGRVEHGYQLNVLDPDLRIVATVDLPDWTTFQPAEAGRQLAEHGYTIRPDAHGWRTAALNLNSWSAPVAPTAGGALVLVVDYPTPHLDGAEACADCAGSGMSGDLYEQPSDDGRPPLLAGAVCLGCLGCGRADHERCAPGAHATDDPDEVDLEDIDEPDEPADACPSCHGRRFWYTAGAGEDDGEAEAAREQLAERARAAGASEWDVAGAAEFGKLDELLGAGAQELAWAADTTVYLRMPCGCAEDRVRTVRGADLEATA